MDAIPFLKLDANEGQCALTAGTLARILSPESVCRYPDSTAFEEALARRLSAEAGSALPAECVMATAGADDSIDRAIRTLAGPGGLVATTDPTFGEYENSATRSGSACVRVHRAPEAAFPMAAVAETLRRRAPALLAVATPDNPGGGILTTGEFVELAGVCRGTGTIFLLDVTYIEFASDRSILGEALRTPGVVTTGSFSKSHGLAGFRIGWAAAHPGSSALVRRMRTAGPTYSISGPAIAAGMAALEADTALKDAYIGRIFLERRRLADMLRGMGLEPCPTEANFVCARTGDPEGLAAALAARGVRVRTWPGKPGSDDLVRITCPGDAAGFGRLSAALEEIGPRGSSWAVSARPAATVAAGTGRLEGREEDR